MRSLKLVSRATALIALATGAACTSTTVEVNVDPQVIEEVTFAESLDIDLAEYTRLESSGIYVKDLVDGTGAELQTQSVGEVDYKAWLVDGTLVYEGVRTWQFGNFEQPLGMEYGALFLREGAVRRMIVPPALAWGDFGTPDGRVPPGAIVVFEVEVLGAR